VQDTLDLALTATGVTQVAVKHRPRLLSDNGSAYISADLAEYLTIGARSERILSQVEQTVIQRCLRFKQAVKRQKQVEKC